MLLGCSDESADVVTGLYSALVELASGLRLGQCGDVGEDDLCGLTQGRVVREHLDPEQGLLCA